MEPQNQSITKTIGTKATGIVTPIIKQGDDLYQIIENSIQNAVEQGEIQIKEGAIVSVTEAVVAISQGNFASGEQVGQSVAKLYDNPKQLAIIDPILSRNRFLPVLEAIAKVPTLEKVWIVLTFPTDEMGNRLISDEILDDSGVLMNDKLTLDDFYRIFGEPKHNFTGVNYPELYKNTFAKGKAEVVFCNNYEDIPNVYCKDILVCRIRGRQRVKKLLQKGGANKVFDLSDILKEPVDGSGYNERFGVYGTNKMSNGFLKLMPINCDEFVNTLQNRLFDKFGVKMEVMIYGDGAFKDPVGGIWELADPEAALGYTQGLSGHPEEVKLKYIASKYPNASQEELQQIILKEKLKRKESSDISDESSLGTTPRRIVDIVASLCDLVTGSGDRQTPVVYITGYLN